MTTAEQPTFTIEISTALEWQVLTFALGTYFHEAVEQAEITGDDLREAEDGEEEEAERNYVYAANVLEAVCGMRTKVAQIPAEQFEQVAR